jgi:hypothetical protein
MQHQTRPRGRVRWPGAGPSWATSGVSSSAPGRLRGAPPLRPAARRARGWRSAQKWVRCQPGSGMWSARRAIHSRWSMASKFRPSEGFMREQRCGTGASTSFCSHSAQRSRRFFSQNGQEDLPRHEDGQRTLVTDAAEKTGLGEWIATLPMAYDTIPPPGGSSVSAGQRQLIAVTAAIAPGCSLLLLAEPTANPDWPAARPRAREPPADWCDSSVCGAWRLGPSTGVPNGDYRESVGRRAGFSRRTRC